MIRTALEFIQKELETYFVDREQDPANYSAGNVVILSPLLGLDNAVLVDRGTHVSAMVVGITEERREGKRPYYLPIDEKNFAKVNPPVELELFILFVAHNSNYETALRDLSTVVCYFQANPVFDEQKYPALNATVVDPVAKPWQLIKRLSFRVVSLTFEQQNNLWAMLGGKYLPSVVYKMTLLNVFDDRPKEAKVAIEELNLNENGL